ncbi:MAG TPA: cytochrome c peroxidase [Myxococcaceae bacterium]|jgi:cytochrome c peroxidase
MMCRILRVLALTFAFASDAEPPSRPPSEASSREDLATLGQRLFFDKRLSGNNTVSCASCHDPARAFADGKRTSMGVSKRALRRNTPALWNLEGRAPYFWDGRAATLEAQALVPLANPDEMGADLAALPAELSAVAEYRERFARHFPGEGVSASTIARALAAYERTLISRSSPYDRYLEGERSALTEQQRLGLVLFNGKAECMTCHNGPDLTDNQFSRVGLVGDDPGRAAIDPVSGPRGGFKTPSLREVSRTAPYFHDGSAATLEEVVEHYVRGGNATVERDIHPIALTQEEKAALVAFLRALSSAR